jgi:2Fe-2S ferredoxin
MSGKNPYLPQQEIEKPARPYKILFHPDAQTVQVDPAKIPYAEKGLPGSLLEIAMGHGIEIEHSCGGVAACSTCHVLVKRGLKSCNEALDEELDQLDNAPGVTFESRLACQCVPNGSEDIEVTIPSWNRNAVKEGH